MNISRRRLWSAMISEIRVTTRAVGGTPVYQLSDLGAQPDEKLAGIIPVVAPGCKITVVEGHVCGQLSKAAETTQLFPLQSPALQVFNLFNGLTRLDEAAAQLADKTGWDPERSFAYTRGLFLWLILNGICLPKNEY